MINFMVLQGFVNQKNDVSGRLFIGEKTIAIKCIFIYIYTDHTECCNITYFGWSSLGFMFGSSLPFPAGLSCISFSSTISSVISTLPCKIFKHINNHKKPQIHKKIHNTLGKTAYAQHMFSILLIHARPPATNSLLGEE